MGGELAPSLGGTKKIFADLNDTFSGKNFNFHAENFLRPSSLVIDQVFQILRFFTLLNVVYDLFFTRKSTISEKNSLIAPFFTLFVLSRASNNTTSLNIGGNQYMGRPPPQIFGEDRPPSSPRSPPLVGPSSEQTRDCLMWHNWHWCVCFVVLQHKLTIHQRDKDANHFCDFSVWAVVLQWYRA